MAYISQEEKKRMTDIANRIVEIKKKQMSRSKNLLKDIEKTIVTQQQEDGLEAYKDHKAECFDMDLPCLPFKVFYARWQEENGLFSDIHMLREV
jgi:hypothetical protein